MKGIRFMPDGEYFALDAVDQSLLKRFMVSPRAYVTARHDDTQTASQKFGSLVHAKVLGSGAEYAVKPDTRTKSGKSQAQEYESRGVVLVSQADLDTAEAMAEVTRPFFETIEGRPEMALLADDPWTGIKLKGKADWLPDKPDSDGIYRIRDYKTTASDPQDFGYTAFKYGYHIQAAFYMNLLRLNGSTDTLGFEFIVQEKTPPYDFTVWRMDEHDEEIDVANMRVSKALKDLSLYLKDDDPEAAMLEDGYDKDPRKIEFSQWQLSQEHMKAGDWFDHEF